MRIKIVVSKYFMRKDGICCLPTTIYIKKAAQTKTLRVLLINQDIYSGTLCENI
jgi:hypothetical protein